MSESEEEIIRRAFAEAVSGLGPLWLYAKSDDFGGLTLAAYIAPADLRGSFVARLCADLKLNPEVITETVRLAYTDFLKSAPEAINIAITELSAVSAAGALERLGYKVETRIVSAPELGHPAGDRIALEVKSRGNLIERTVIDRGRLSQWKREDLEPVIQGALALLPRARRNYGNVLSILRGIYGDNAPDTPEALRKVIDRADIDWKKLKADFSE